MGLFVGLLNTPRRHRANHSLAAIMDVDMLDPHGLSTGATRLVQRCVMVAIGFHEFRGDASVSFALIERVSARGAAHGRHCTGMGSSHLHRERGLDLIGGRNARGESKPSVHLGLGEARPTKGFGQRV